MFDPILAYVGPETMLPLSSVVAGAVGFAMMFGRQMVRGVSKLFLLPQDLDDPRLDRA